MLLLTSPDYRVITRNTGTPGPKSKSLSEQYMKMEKKMESSQICFASVVAKSTIN